MLMSHRLKGRYKEYGRPKRPKGVPNRCDFNVW